MARKTKYTPETVTKVVEAVKMGATYELAAAYAGISESLFYEWLKGKVEFLEQVKAAEGVAALGWLAKIEQAAADGAWQAAAWKLERRYPEMYGRDRAGQAQPDSGMQITVVIAQRPHQAAGEASAPVVPVVIEAERDGSRSITVK